MIEGASLIQSLWIQMAEPAVCKRRVAPIGSRFSVVFWYIRVDRLKFLLYLLRPVATAGEPTYTTLFSWTVCSQMD